MNTELLNESEVIKLKNALLAINGSLIRLGVNTEETFIVLPKYEWSYFNLVLKTKQSGMHKFYQETDDTSFMLAGLKIVSSVSQVKSEVS